MNKFIAGFIVAVVVVLVGLFLWVRFGMVDPRADIRPGSLERATMMPALDASVARRAPRVKNPVQATDANLLSGMQIYQTHCAICHGDIVHPDGGLLLNPPAPQFMRDAPDMPENQNYYIIQHGVRLSGMPAWEHSLSPRKIWQVTTFLSHMDKLPPEISDQWKVLARAGAAPPPQQPPMEGGMPMK